MEEDNKLIAEFMGATTYEAPNFHNEILLWAKYHKSEMPPSLDEKGIRNVSSLEYHTSWDWLMPVVEKIENFDYCVEIENNYCCIYRDCNSNIVDKNDNSKIDAVYKAIIEFIKWYNNQSEDGRK